MNSTVLPDGDQPAQRFERAAAERRVADRQHFVDQHDVGVAVDRDAEAEPRVEARRVALHRRVDQPLDIGKLHDRVELAIDLLARQAEQAGAEVDVLAAGQLGMKAGAELDQRHDVAGDAHLAAGRPGHARDQLQQRRLAGAVAADDAEAGALRAPRTTRRAGRGSSSSILPRVALCTSLLRPRSAVERAGDQIDDGARAAGAVALGDVLELNGDGHG